jgi:hypothetical protein
MKKIILTLVITKSLMGCGQNTAVPVKTIVLPTVKCIVKPAIDSTKISKELLVSYLIYKKIHHPEVAYAIIRQESNMCSNLFKTNNNLFGMRHPRVRPNKSLGNKKGFAHFESWQHSVEDYKLYVEFVGGHKMTRAQYLSHIDRSYAHAGYSAYISKFFDEFHTIKKN